MSNMNTAISPWSGFRDLESQLDRMLRGESGSAAGTWVPPVDIRETDDAYVLEADLPGMKKEEIDVQIMEDQVILRGERKREETTESKGFRRFERAEGRFERDFRIRGGVDVEKAEAKFEHGVLTVRLPKPETAKPRQIEVKAE